MNKDNFVFIETSPNNADRWIVRTSILQALREHYPMLRGRLLDAGCGKMPYRKEILEHTDVDDYCGLDIAGAIVYDDAVRPDAVWDGVSMPFADGSFDCVLATEVLEHVPDIGTYLKEAKRVMKPGAVFFFTTPFLWPYHEAPHDRQRWTAFGLENQFKEAGFTSWVVQSWGNWHSSLAQLLGLWVARAPMNRHLRRLLRRPVFWLQRLLMLHDSPSPNAETAMPRMIVGTAIK